MGVIGTLKRNKITQGLGRTVGGSFLVKVADFKPLALIENGILCGCFLRILPKF